jgi:hypothetical protein
MIQCYTYPINFNSDFLSDVIGKCLVMCKVKHLDEMGNFPSSRGEIDRLSD